MTESERNLFFMEKACELAEYAFSRDEVPIGAVIVTGDTIIGQGWNRVEEWKDPTAHAEMIAIRDAVKTVDLKRLTEAELYITIEPCVMCAGAIWQARLKTVYFGAVDQKAGAYGSLYNIAADQRLNHRPTVIKGILEDRCRCLMQNFFRAKR
jgi:tRNA(adenine34) deaminase